MPWCEHRRRLTPDRLLHTAPRHHPLCELLQVRVSSWRQRIDPILRQEEDRSAFDIHEYGSALLQRLETLTLVTPGDAGDAQPAKVAAGRSKAQQQQEAGSGDVYGFGEVVAADNPYEVCRSFAAMLQLVNNRWGR